jgi:hypothetical protein
VAPLTGIASRSPSNNGICGRVSIRTTARVIRLCFIELPGSDLMAVS